MNHSPWGGPHDEKHVLLGQQTAEKRMSFLGKESERRSWGKKNTHKPIFRIPCMQGHGWMMFMHIMHACVYGVCVSVELMPMVLRDAWNGMDAMPCISRL
jgi:hypothetical protein